MANVAQPSGTTAAQVRKEERRQKARNPDLLGRFDDTLRNIVVAVLALVGAEALAAWPFVRNELVASMAKTAAPGIIDMLGLMRLAQIP